MLLISRRQASSRNFRIWLSVPFRVISWVVSLKNDHREAAVTKWQQDVLVHFGQLHRFMQFHIREVVT